MINKVKKPLLLILGIYLICELVKDFEFLVLKLHAALHACTTMNENQVQQTRQYGKI